MGSTREEQERVRSLLLDTVTLLCKNGLNFKKQLKVQGLLGITLDEDDVFIVHINEKVGELVVTQQKKDKHYEEDSDESSVDSPPAKVNRKRRSDSSPMYRGPPDKICIKTEKEEPDEDLILIEDHADDKSQIQRTLLQQQQPPGMHSVTNFQTGYQNYGHQNNMHGAPGYMTSPGAVNNTQQHTLPHPNIPQTGQPTPEKCVPMQFDRFRGAPLDLGFVPRRDRSSEVKNYNCQHSSCNKKYYDKSSLFRHYRDKHGGVYPKGSEESSTSCDLPDEKFDANTKQICSSDNIQLENLDNSISVKESLQESPVASEREITDGSDKGNKKVESLRPSVCIVPQDYLSSEKQDVSEKISKEQMFTGKQEPEIQNSNSLGTVISISPQELLKTSSSAIEGLNDSPVRILGEIVTDSSINEVLFGEANI